MSGAFRFRPVELDEAGRQAMQLSADISQVVSLLATVRTDGLEPRTIGRTEAGIHAAMQLAGRSADEAAHQAPQLHGRADRARRADLAIPWTPLGWINGLRETALSEYSALEAREADPVTARNWRATERVTVAMRRKWLFKHLPELTLRRQIARADLIRGVNRTLRFVDVEGAIGRGLATTPLVRVPSKLPARLLPAGRLFGKVFPAVGTGLGYLEAKSEGYDTVGAIGKTAVTGATGAGVGLGVMVACEGGTWWTGVGLFGCPFVAAGAAIVVSTFAGAGYDKLTGHKEKPKPKPARGPAAPKIVPGSEEGTCNAVVPHPEARPL